MFVRCKLQGDGDPAAAWRVPLPTKEFIFENPTDSAVDIVVDHPDFGVQVKVHLPVMSALVWMPDSDIHPDWQGSEGSEVERVGRAEVLVKMDPAHHDHWHKHLDRRYLEHSGKFRPRLV